MHYETCRTLGCNEVCCSQSFSYLLLRFSHQHIHCFAIFHNILKSSEPYQTCTTDDKMTTTDVQTPSKHKAIVYDNPGSISTKTEVLDTPKPDNGEVWIKI